MSEFLTIKEIASMLNISVATTYRLIQAQEINFYKIGRSVRVREGDFNKHLADNKIDSIQ